MNDLNDALESILAVEIHLRKQGETWYADILSDAADTIRAAVGMPKMVFNMTQVGNNNTQIVTGGQTNRE